jgi:CBS domain-containing protein
MKEAADVFLRYGFRALPVTDNNDTILGRRAVSRCYATEAPPVSTVG